MPETAVRRHTRVALAYVTSSDRLLVEEEIHHDSGGLRVPTRMIADGMTPEGAARREVERKAGLESLTVRAELGHYTCDMSPLLDEIQERHVLWLEYDGDRRDAWRSANPGTADAGVEMYYWMDIREIPELFAEHDTHLGELRSRILGVDDGIGPEEETIEMEPLSENERSRI